MDFELSDELKLLQDTARRFTNEELIPHELEVDEHSRISEAARTTIRERACRDGLWPMNVPQEFGGLGSSVLAQVIVQEQAGRATNHLWGYVGGPYNALQRCNEAQRKKYLEPALTGEWTASYAVTEPGAGSDTSNLTTSAVKRGDHYVINGEKWFVSGGEKGLAVIVHTLTAPGEETLFLVDHGTPGMRIKRLPRFMNRSEDEHAEIVFEDCAVPEGQMLGERGEADAISKAWFREERLHIAARSLGAAQRLMEEMKAWCAERETFGKKLYEHQGIGWLLADSATELYAARLVTYKTAWEEDAGVCDVKELHTKASIAKLYASEMAHRVADRAVQAFGGRGYCCDYAVERLFRDTRVDRIWEGTSEMMRSIILNGVMKRDLDELLS
ncbi:MAG: acyl-CoA/acyl-ACP dehydrogenase [Deltaproteobacteria bacterium]|nr:acyl-CoA/acyl-ACP dehydrogenase [Deltaproteobacteria bacterium]